MEWCSVAPVEYRHPEGALELPFDFGHGVILTRKPEWLTDEGITKHLGYVHRERLADSGPYALVVEYDAASLGDTDPDWKGSKPYSKQASALERMWLVELALWIARPSGLTFRSVVHADRSHDTWGLREFPFDVRRLIPHPKDANARLTNDDLELARNLGRPLPELPRGGAIWTALWMLRAALSDMRWEIRFLPLWVALEALFGPEDPREITYRLSQRVAFFLASDRQEARELFDKAKKGYAWRSKVVHGARLTKLRADEEQAMDILYDAETLIRRALNSVLTDPHLIRQFDGKNRERYLDELIYLE